MHVLITCKFKRIGSIATEKGGDIDFRRSGAANSAVGRQILTKFELIKVFYTFPYYLQVSKGLDNKQPRKSGDIVFLL